MTIDTARLATDAGYWDSVAGTATHYCPSNRQFYDFRLHPCCIPRPQPQPEWVDGLPPVGTKCEINPHGYCWFAATILAYGKTKFIYEIAPGQVDDEGDLIGGELDGVIATTKFRPISTKAKRDRDELGDMISCRGVLSIGEGLELADAIIAEGWTKP